MLGEGDTAGAAPHTSRGRITRECGSISRPDFFGKPVAVGSTLLKANGSRYRDGEAIFNAPDRSLALQIGTGQGDSLPDAIVEGDLPPRLFVLMSGIWALAGCLSSLLVDSMGRAGCFLIL